MRCICLLVVVATCLGVSAPVVGHETPTPTAKHPLPAIELQLKHIKARVMKEQNWSVEFTEAVADEYIRFWWLHKTYPDAYLVPSLAVDEMWHAHILFTAKYAADCERVFGSFLHHYPTIDETDGADATAEATEATGREKAVDAKTEKESDYDAMLALYESEFGFKPNFVWVKQQNSSSNGKGCGNCHGGSDSGSGAGCSNCSNCGSKCKNKTGCGNCHGGAHKSRKTGAGAAGCGNCHGAGKNGKEAAGCGNCHGKKKSDAGAGCSNCSNCGSKCKNKTGESAGCGNCHGAGDKKTPKQSAGCGNCHAGRSDKPKTSDKSTQTDRA